MSKTIKRDTLRGAISYLQNKTGVKKFSASKVNSITECYDAIYEIVKTDVELGLNKKLERQITLNKTLNELNCELVKEKEELTKRLDNVKAYGEKLIKDITETQKNNTDLKFELEEVKREKTLIMAELNSKTDKFIEVVDKEATMSNEIKELKKMNGAVLFAVLVLIGMIIAKI